MSPYSLDHISLRSYVLRPRAGLLTARGLSLALNNGPPLQGVRTRRSGLPEALWPPSLTVARRRAASRRQSVPLSSAFPFPRVVKDHIQKHFGPE